MFQALLGEENVDTVTNEVVHKTFSYWASGSILKVIEEVQAADGSGGYDLLNKLKEPITNDRLMVEHKSRDGVQIVNTATWLGFTNDPAALPLGADSSRYLVLSSRFRTRAMADAYLVDNPRFFKDFEIAFTKHAPALRNFFAKWQRLPTFDASRRAPDTASTRQMRESSVPEALLSIRDAIENDRYIGISADLINLGALKQLYQDSREKPAPRRLARLMSELGYAPVVSGEPGVNRGLPRRGVRAGAREVARWRLCRPWSDQKTLRRSRQEGPEGPGRLGDAGSGEPGGVRRRGDITRKPANRRALSFLVGLPQGIHQVHR
jgi:hypothetical protein